MTANPDDAHVAPALIDPGDEATRYLAAAAHLDAELADELVEECLAEPCRMVLHSPGVRASVVLREAVAAQAARRIGSAALLVLLLITFVLSPGLVLLWLASGLAWRTGGWLVARIRRNRQANRPQAPPDRGATWGPTAALWLPVFTVYSFLIVMPVVYVGAAVRINLGIETPVVDTPIGYVYIGRLGFPVVALALAMLCVLFVLRYLPWVLADRRFRFGRFDPDAPPREFVTLACRPFEARLRRIDAEEERNREALPRNLIIYRGHDPFVGAGARVRTWSQAIELHPAAATPGAPMPEFTAGDLHRAIADDVDALRKAPDLSPGGRFAGLEIRDTALLSAGHILHYPDARYFFRELEARRDPTLAERYWHGLYDRSPEWLRFYRCFRVESWEREVACSGYLHVGYERRTLYLEWNGFVLPPIWSRYRTVDTPPTLPALYALWRALGDLALAPASIRRRVADLWRWGRDLRGAGRGRLDTPERVAHSLGVAATVREIGTGMEFPNFFQETDADRYLKILEQRVLDAIQRFLTAQGVATDAFSSMVTQINNATVMNGCTVIAGSVGGSGNQGAVTTGAAPTTGTSGFSANSTPGQ
ncbi:hypothetical protein IU433_25100 [Nocardia puris]|uniref:hypothetical protein n=1 Tax=Nocardia puris TaxID=208602 RepID=UPI001892DCD0|nr:hypothetical protein [Nocardia puris]MBF6213413.1 hypothetical protein [Nocardia puris]MBF6369418.1 hypothetical protein [Nocardia puris]MBF6462293.1 hypothetical protein [Nocardia puris]